MVKNGRHVVRLFLSGSFRVELLSGEDVTPRSAKAQALLALLATAQNGARSRAWLQSRLWSDRAPEQASGSLRQCLVQIRQSLADVPDVLKATRQKITLDFSKVEIVVSDLQELLEGLDVRDEAFDDWLRAARNNRTAIKAHTPAEPQRPAQAAQKSKLMVIKCKTVGDGDTGPAEWLSHLLSDTVARNIRETFSIDVVVGDETVPANAREVTIETSRFGASQAGVRMVLTNAGNGAQLWAGNRIVKMHGAPPNDHPDLLQLGNQLVEAVGDNLYEARSDEYECPDALCRHAIRELFTMRPDAVTRADAMLAKAYEMSPRGLYLAWRAQAKTIIQIERYDVDEQALSEESRELCEKALAVEPNNSMVLATLSNTYSQLFKEHEKGRFLAERSIQLNPSNPMAWDALSSVSMYAGDERKSLNYALRGNQLTLTSPYRFWWDTQVFAAALALNHLPEAQHFAEKCYAQNPDFRPPLRYLIAFYCNEGRAEDAHRIAEKLKALEPDFSIERLVKDRSYPASLLHRDNGLNLDRVAELA